MATPDKKLGQQLIDEIDKYKEQLYKSKNVSPTKFMHFQIALYGAKCIIRENFKIAQQSETAWVK